MRGLLTRPLSAYTFHQVKLRRILARVPDIPARNALMVGSARRRKPRHKVLLVDLDGLAELVVEVGFVSRIQLPPETHLALWAPLQMFFQVFQCEYQPNCTP